MGDTCLGCGCACDDIELRVAGGRIVEAGNACALGAAWFGDGGAPSRVRIRGREATFDEALDAAAALFDAARRPLVYLAPGLSCEAQREGVALADGLRSALDSATSAGALEGILAAQERGRASATLGEIRRRADLLVFWGVDPAQSHPRFRERAVPPGCEMVAVDVGDAHGPADVPHRVVLRQEEEDPALTLLTARVRVRPGAGVPWSSDPPLVEPLAARLLGARYAVIVADGEGGARGSRRASGLIALTQTLNGSTRAALATLRKGGNRSGADAVLVSQTGYPAAVDFFRGAPRYRPVDGTAEARLASGEVDALAVIGDAGEIPAELLVMMTRVPAVVVGPRASASAFAGGAVVVDTGVAGVHEGGSALRMDDVPLPLRMVVAGPPETRVAVRDLRRRLTKADASGPSARRIGAPRS